MHFKNLKFKHKILITFLSVFFFLFAIGSPVAYYQIKKKIQFNIEQELQNTTDSVVNSIKTAALISLKTRLRAIAEKNLDIAQYYYSKYRSGLLSREQAFKIIEETFLNQSIGVSGYIYCVNSKGIVVIHPDDKVRNQDLSQNDVVRKILEIKDGYFEYKWKNPDEAQERQKIVYMVYYKSLDWIICVSAYREDLNYLVDIDDFKESILSYKTGKTGYVFLLDEKGKFLVHPTLEGKNFLSQSKYSNDFLKQLLKQKNGKFQYEWQNPGESKPQKKIAIFRHLPEYQWIVVSSNYVKEIFSPLKTFKKILAVVLILIFLLSVGITYFIAVYITKNFDSFMDKFEQGADGDLSVRMEIETSDEFGRLSRHFNSFMDQLEKDDKKIKLEIQKNRDTQLALVENELKLKGIFDQSFQYAAILSPSGVLEELNKAGRDFAGDEQEKSLYKQFHQMPWWQHDSDVQKLIEQSVKKASSGDFVRFETTAISNNEEIKYIDISIKPVFNIAGDVTLIIAEARDITEYKQTAQEKKQMAVQLEKSQRMEAIGTLAGGIAHDFNNILSGILGYSQLAELSLDNPAKAKQHIAQISKGAQRAASLIQQILTFSRQTENKKQTLTLYHVVREALKLLRSSIPSTIGINENIVARAKIVADPTQMHQIVMNLCTNAYHAMGESGGTLSIQLFEVDILHDKDFLEQKVAKGKYLKLEVSDTGSGMDEKILLKAFDPYFTTKEIGKGTGLGLSLVYGIVEDHGGFIKIDSTMGKGTSFYVFLPIVEPDRDLHSVMEEEQVITGGTEKIMFVDDEENLRLIAREFLEDYGYKVAIFEDGAKAFEAFEKEVDCFDLIVTDMTMPKMTGFEFSRKVLKLRQNMPIILCTGYSEILSKEDVLSLGVQKYVQKPLANNDLAVLIRDILDDN